MAKECRIAYKQQLLSNGSLIGIAFGHANCIKVQPLSLSLRRIIIPKDRARRRVVRQNLERVTPVLPWCTQPSINPWIPCQLVDYLTVEALGLENARIVEGLVFFCRCAGWQPGLHRAGSLYTTVFMNVQLRSKSRLV
jgi:hypothetical protein